MKTVAGLWIDHREAVIVFSSPQGEATKEIRSNAEKHAGRIDGVRSTTSYESQLVSADDRRQSSFTGHLNSYYDKVIACLCEAESILIFGPGEAKDELKKRMERYRPSKRIAAVETADKMTDRQIAAKVREYFQGRTLFPEFNECANFQIFGKAHPRNSRVSVLNQL